MSDDLTEAHRQVLGRTRNAAVSIERSIAAAATTSVAPSFVATSFDAARKSADDADRAVEAGTDPGRLAGLAISIKDLFDVAGQVTAAGSVVLAASASVIADAPAVQRLRQAGAALIGRTHMSEFAFSGVGLNPHHPRLVNVGTLALDPTERVPGGSTSGGASSVAGGAAWAALGSDTGGSIRIPAALQGLVGFKSTACRVPTTGALPLSTTLDTVSAITLSVRDAIVLHEILADRRAELSRRPLAGSTFAVPSRLMLDGLDDVVARSFRRTLSALSAAGARIEEIELALLDEVAPINAAGGFAAAESWALHRRWLASQRDQYDPRVVRRIMRGEAMSAADYIDLIAARRSWIGRMEDALRGFDALLSPTVPMVAPPLAPLVDDDDAFFAVNSLLLRNPSVVNLLDGCALSLPCHAAGELPAGLMVWSTGGRDDAVLDAGLAIEAALARAAGTEQRRG